MQRNKILFIISLIIYSILLLLIHLLKLRSIQTFTFSYVSSSAVFLIISLIIIKYDLPKFYIISAFVIGLLIRISFINTIPIGSDDIYRYMWDGKVQSYGINPYQYVPNEQNLSFLHSNILPQKVNFPNLKTIYFPLSQWLFYLGYSLSGEQVWGYKFLLFIFELITIITLYLILKKLKSNSKFILLYALCPLPIIQFALDSHLDGFGLSFMLLAVLFYLKNKLLPSLIFLGLSFSIKPVGLLLLPIMFFREEKIFNKIYVIIIPYLAFFIQFIPYIFSSNPFESLFIYAKHWSFNGSVFSLLNFFINNNQTTRIVCGILLIISLIPIYINKEEPIKKFYYSVLLLFIFSPVVHPWYISWLTILLPIIPKWSGIVYSSLSSLTAFTVLSYQQYGLWKEYSSVLLIEYIPVILIMLYELGFLKKYLWSMKIVKKISEKL